jgi:hypothetical protein
MEAAVGDAPEIQQAVADWILARAG